MDKKTLMNVTIFVSRSKEQWLRFRTLSFCQERSHFRDNWTLHQGSRVGRQIIWQLCFKTIVMVPTVCVESIWLKHSLAKHPQVPSHPIPSVPDLLLWSFSMCSRLQKVVHFAFDLSQFSFDGLQLIDFHWKRGFGVIRSQVCWKEGKQSNQTNVHHWWTVIRYLSSIQLKMNQLINSIVFNLLQRLYRICIFFFFLTVAPLSLVH